MQQSFQAVSQLIAAQRGYKVTSIEPLPQSGSDRIYFRIRDNNTSYIATYGLNIKENKTFINFSRHFKKQGLPVPEIFAVSEDYTGYIQEDLGNESLLNKL